MRLTLVTAIVFLLVVLAACGGQPAPSSNVRAGASANVASANANGPQTSWMVVTLPNPQVTPAWQQYAPQDCQPDPSVCAEDHRFWEEWDFSAFRDAIDASFTAINTQGRYHGVMLLMPLADSPQFWNNIQLMYNAASAQGLAFQAVVFPKSKYGPEPCYLYNSGAPSDCATVPGTSAAVAYQQLVKTMTFVENLGQRCDSGQSNRPFAVWYGWDALPGYDTLQRFWNSLPTSGCNLRASYITWLDTMYSDAPEVGQLQSFVVNTLKQEYHVNTELYSDQQIQGSYTRYAPYQTVITGTYGANTTSDWAQGMCAKWKVASQPAALGVWNFGDRDVAPVEQYRALINGSLANVNNICTE